MFCLSTHISKETEKFPDIKSHQYIFYGWGFNNSGNPTIKPGIIYGQTSSVEKRFKDYIKKYFDLTVDSSLRLLFVIYFSDYNTVNNFESYMRKNAKQREIKLNPSQHGNIEQYKLIPYLFLFNSMIKSKYLDIHYSPNYEDDIRQILNLDEDIGSDDEETVVPDDEYDISKIAIRLINSVTSSAEIRCHQIAEIRSQKVFDFIQKNKLESFGDIKRIKGFGDTLVSYIENHFLDKARKSVSK